VTDGLFSEESMCTFILPVCDAENWTPIDLNAEVDEQLLEKVPIAKENDFLNEMYEQYEELQEKSDLVKIVVLNDLMVDYDYEAGMSNQCVGLKCCNKDSGEGLGSTAAGEWGDLSCYMPPKTFKSMLDYIRDEVKPDIAFVSGNLIAH
jgi:hypothetical protein